MTTIETFKKMLDWLYANTEANNQTDVARKAGMSQVTMSRILNGKVKNVKPETLRAVNDAYGNVFNPEWMRGESSVMLIADLPATGSDASPSEAHSPTLPGIEGITAAIIKAKEETIEALRGQLDDKERMISGKDEVIASKDALIDALQQQITTLRTQMTIEKGLSEDGGSTRTEVSTPSQQRLA